MENKEKLLKLGYSGNAIYEDVELFLNNKYNFNIRNVDCFTHIGRWNEYQPENVPDGYYFFFKDYIKNETNEQWLNRMINLAMDLIIKYK